MVTGRGGCKQGLGNRALLRWYHSLSWASPSHIHFSFATNTSHCKSIYPPHCLLNVTLAGGSQGGAFPMYPKRCHLVGNSWIILLTHESPWVLISSVYRQHLGKMVGRCKFFCHYNRFLIFKSKIRIDFDIWNLPCSSGKEPMVMTRYLCGVICQVFINGLNTLSDDRHPLWPQNCEIWSYAHVNNKLIASQNPPHHLLI